MNWYSTEHVMSGGATLAEAADLKHRLRAVEGLTVVDKGDGKLWLLIGEPKSLNGAPPGSHEFARGFLLLSAMVTTRHELGNKDVWWDVCEVLSTDGPRLRPAGTRVQVTHDRCVVKRDDPE